MTHTRSELLPDQALKACWDKIESLNPGDLITVNSMAPKKPQLWISCAKQWIDCFKLAEFNHNYTTLRKLEEIIR